MARICYLLIYYIKSLVYQIYYTQIASKNK